VALAVLVGIGGLASNTHAQMSYQVVATFHGSGGMWPVAGLVQGNDGNFYGTTVFNFFDVIPEGSGTIFKMDAAGTLTILHSFSISDGASPSYAGLIQATDGNFYGTTEVGGAAGYGTIFKIDAAGTLTTVHTLIEGEGKRPVGRLIQATDGNFYGTTLYDTATGSGSTIFKIDAAGTLTTLHTFDYLAGVATLIQGNDGNFYGTTPYGGPGACTAFFGPPPGCGTVFKMDAVGTMTTLHSFGVYDPENPDSTYYDGTGPSGGLLQGSDGGLYGTTDTTVFKIDAAGALTVLHRFIDGDGVFFPSGGLIQGSDGTFYGAAQGGAEGYGAIFKIDAAGALTILYSFNSNDGYWLGGQGGLLQASDGSLYGTTLRGGPSDFGTVYRLTVQTPTSTTLTVSPTPSMFGQSVTLTASVTTTSGTPTGSVELFDGSSSLGTATLNSGTAALNTSTLTTGSHALRAEYAGAIAFAPSTSPAVTQLVVLPATFINPATNGANVDPTQPLTWTSVTGVQAYYLYVGSTLGAKDIVSTGEIHQTSYLLPVTLPVNQTLYARLWTKAGGVWRFTDRTFSAIPIVARFTYPAAGTTTVDPTQPLTWTTLPTAQAYYLYVGSTPGAKDFVNTGEMQQTSYLLRSTVPVNQTLYARLWTKVGGVWRFTDRTFSVIPIIASFTYPAAGTTTVDPTQPLTWTTVPTAQAYYLYVGSTLGAKDIVSTGEMQQTSYLLRSTVPVNQTLFARLWTKLGGVWGFTDRTFSVIPIIAAFTYPADGTTTVDPTQPLTWTTVPTAQAYYLYVGSTLGAKDIVSTGEMQQTSYLLRSTVPVNQTLYARLWTKVAGVWRYVDRSFTLVLPGQLHSIVIDGNTQDWAGIAPLSIDAGGDGPFNQQGQYFPGEDFRSVTVANDSTSVYLLLEFAANYSGGILLPLDTDLDSTTGCNGAEYAIFVTGSEPGAGFALSDYRDCQFSNDFPGAVRSQVSVNDGRFVEAAIPLATLRTLTPGLTGFRLSGVAIAPPPSGVNDSMGQALYAIVLPGS
jgi:uncharacterized repeat protein (TIGR03803 family)